MFPARDQPLVSRSCWTSSMRITNFRFKLARVDAARVRPADKLKSPICPSGLLGTLPGDVFLVDNRLQCRAQLCHHPKPTLEHGAKAADSPKSHFISPGGLIRCL